MDVKILDHYRECSLFTSPGAYKQTLAAGLPDDVREIGRLIRTNTIHRMVLAMGNTGSNADMKYGDMTEVQWWRQPEDDNLVTASAMLAELYRRDPRGLVADRRVRDRIVITCRFVAILTACVLKSKGVPARVRSGNALYFERESLGKVSVDHWINQYWNEAAGRWVTIDADGIFEIKDFDPFDMPESSFDFPARAWLDIRAGKDDAARFYNGKPERGAIVVLWSLFYDFHSLMNNEIIYMHNPIYGDPQKFPSLTAQEMGKIDGLARLMLDADANFDALKEIFETQRDFRLLTGALLR
jgi:hypothetical protein